MEVVLAVVRPKQNVSGQDYRPKLYDILLLDHKNVDKYGPPTKFLPVVEEGPRDGILTQLYNITGGDLGGIKGERVLHIPSWKRDSLSRRTMFCIPVSSRDKLSSVFVDKSVISPGFYPMDGLLQALNSGSINFPTSTQSLMSQLESWLKEKHSKAGALDIIFRARGEFRITLSVNNPVFLPLSMGLDRRNDLTDEIQPLQLAAHESLTKMMEVEKCEKVVINPLFGSGMKPRKSRMNKVSTWTSLPPPDYFDSNTTSRKGSLNSSIDPDSYSLHEREQNPLHIFASKGDVIKVNDCITRGYNLEKRDSFGWTPIHCAAFYGYNDVVQMLLRSGCSPNVVNSDDRTPLHLAANKGYPAVVSVLLSHPEIDMNIVDKEGRTALEMCEQKLSWEHIQVAKIIEKAAKQPRQITVQQISFLCFF